MIFAGTATSDCMIAVHTGHLAVKLVDFRARENNFRRVVNGVIYRLIVVAHLNLANIFPAQTVNCVGQKLLNPDHQSTGSVLSIEKLRSNLANIS